MTAARLMLVVGTLTTLVASGAAAEDWFPSKWGASDTLGSVNLITEESIVSAAKLVKTGKRYPLGQVVSRETPAFGSRTFELFAVSHGGVLDGTSDPWGELQMTTNDDWVLAFMGVGSQLDGLGHVGINHVYYNGNKVKDFFSPGGLTKLSTDQIPPIVARGIVLDIVGWMKENNPKKVMTVDGLEMLKEGVAINQKEIDGALARQKLEVQKGDVILLHTGYMEMADIDQARYMKSLPGLGHKGALYLAGLDPVAIGGDTYAVEVLPSKEEGVLFPVHIELLPKRGIYILENMVTRELVNDRAWEFMFVLGQARLKGAVQMIINPVAIR